MSPLLPLSIRDMVWLRAYRVLKEKAEDEKYKLELKIRQEKEKWDYLIFCDIRKLVFDLIGFGPEDALAAEEEWSKLPTMKECGYQTSMKSVGVSRGVKKAEEAAKNRGEDLTAGIG